MRLKRLTPKTFFYNPALKATKTQLNEAGIIITRFLNKNMPIQSQSADNNFLNISQKYLKKCWFSDDYKLNSAGKKWMTDLLEKFNLDNKSPLSELVSAIIQTSKSLIKS